MRVKRLLLSVAALVLVAGIVIGGWTFYDAWQMGVLPWQPEPTRIVVTPFADLPTPSATPGN
ncbi:MAG: hypothetical protein KC435_08180 [Thermomicrobiales bacterium]|nr:hypothetical protein [Thermomicrobiales bacterium]